jgi:diguanylate cyclase (GGDEF)-like protein
MISIKRYLDSDLAEIEGHDESAPSDPLAVALDTYGSVLLEMGNCSLEACPGIGDQLKQKLGRLQAGLSPSMTPESIEAHGEQAQKLLSGWGQDVSRHYRETAREVKDILLSVARTAESVSARDQRSAGQMNAVTCRLEAIATLEDLTEIRASIQKSAADLKSSIDRMTEEGKDTLAHLKKQVEAYQVRLEEAERVASRDAVTGANSRVYLERQIENRIAAGAPFCVAIVDIDGFKKVNDQYGHLTGDDLLKQFAAELRSTCRATDLIGRWGGDEFILLFDGTLEVAEAQAERLRKWAFGDYKVSANRGALKLRVDASIGLAAHAAGEDLKKLLTRADAAMYKQKAITRAKAR